MWETLLKIIEMLTPVFLTIIVQGLKKLFNKSGYIALVMVFVLGGIGALIGVGPVPVDSFIDTTVNGGYIIGLATFIYALFKKRE